MSKPQQLSAVISIAMTFPKGIGTQQSEINFFSGYKLTRSVNLTKIKLKASAQAEFQEVKTMNGLKLIRIRCNYSQTALAEKLNVSRQAINMWENSKKSLSEKRKEELKEFFGIENTDWFDEIDDETAAKIKALPMYKCADDISEHFHFSTAESSHVMIMLPQKNDPALSLDDMCTLKRQEFKLIISEFQDYAENNGVKNSYDRLANLNRIQRVLTGIYDALNGINNKKSIEKMIYFYTLFAIIDSINIAFGNVTLEEVLNAKETPKRGAELYDYSEFTKEVSELFSAHLNKYTERINAIQPKPRKKE